MKNRVEKLLKEKRRALSNIRFAKNRAVFNSKVNNEKEMHGQMKQNYREAMHEKLDNQRQLVKQHRQQTKENILQSKIAKIEENREKKRREKAIKEAKRKESEMTKLMLRQRVDELKKKVSLHKKQKSQKLEGMKNYTNDQSMIRYHIKNQKLGSTRELHLQEIAELERKEKELMEQLKHTLDRQEQIENEANSPVKLRRAPSLTMDAKLALFKNKLGRTSKAKKAVIKENESFGSYFSKDSVEPEKPVDDSDLNRGD
jgi:hypothetical protein